MTHYGSARQSTRGWRSRNSLKTGKITGNFKKSDVTPALLHSPLIATMITYHRVVWNFVNLELFSGVRGEPTSEAAIAVAVLS
jgi:hypothetical protein